MGKIRSNDQAVSGAIRSLKALPKYLSIDATLPAEQKLMTRKELQELFQGALDARGAVVKTLGEYKTALAKRDALEVRLRSVDRALRQWVLNRFGPESVEAHDFGYAPQKRAEPTVQTKARAALLNEATRRARGTVGPKKKLAIKGTLDESTLTGADSSVGPKTSS